MKKRVLITGASGFVGYHLIAAALASNLEVYAAVRPTSNISHLSEFDIRNCLARNWQIKNTAISSMPLVLPKRKLKPNMMKLTRDIPKTSP
jgi:nucleoside-diphosphate-sugar epimerase